MERKKIEEMNRASVSWEAISSGLMHVTEDPEGEEREW